MTVSRLSVAFITIRVQRYGLILKLAIPKNEYCLKVAYMTEIDLK